MIDERQFLQLCSVACLGIEDIGVEFMGVKSDKFDELGGEFGIILYDGGDGYVFENVIGL